MSKDKGVERAHLEGEWERKTQEIRNDAGVMLRESYNQEEEASLFLSAFSFPFTVQTLRAGTHMALVSTSCIACCTRTWQGVGLRDIFMESY